MLIASVLMILELMMNKEGIVCVGVSRGGNNIGGCD
jgi:hypothetical protein